MNTSQISVRYAKALFLSAHDADELEMVFHDVNLIFSAIQDNPDFRSVLDNPVVTNTDKRKILQNTFQSFIRPLTNHFLDIVLKNNREIFLPDMARDFIDLYKKEQGITYAQLITATPVNKKITGEIKRHLKERIKTEIQLSVYTDPNIIGGFILNIEDTQFDASVRSSLRNLKKELVRRK